MSAIAIAPAGRAAGPAPSIGRHRPVRVLGRRPALSDHRSAPSGQCAAPSGQRSGPSAHRLVRDVVPASVGRAPVAEGPLRLTRRGRVVVWLMGVLVAALAGGAAASAQADGPSSATEVRRVVVTSGETLWGIAADVASPGEDVRDVVLRLMELNDLPSGALVAGQTIVVPVG